MNRIGTANIVHFTSLIIPPNEEARIEFVVDSWSVRLDIKFAVDTTPENKKPNLTLVPKDDYAVLTLKNWDALGTATEKPLELGTTPNGKKIYFMIWQAVSGTVRRLDLQFTKEIES